MVTICYKENHYNRSLGIHSYIITVGNDSYDSFVREKSALECSHVRAALLNSTRSGNFWPAQSGVYKWGGEIIFLYKEEFHFTRSYTRKRNLLPFRRNMWFNFVKQIITY
jgi:hypothetical protein